MLSASQNKHSQYIKKGVVKDYLQWTRESTGVLPKQSSSNRDSMGILFRAPIQTHVSGDPILGMLSKEYIPEQAQGNLTIYKEDTVDTF